MAPEDAIRLIRPTIDRYLDVLRRNRIQPRRVYLYDSFAAGTPHEGSDIDLAIVSEDLTGRRFDDQMTLVRLTWDVDMRIEPHPFRPEDFTPDDPEVQEILETGVPIN